MRRDSERISFSIDSIARRGIASVMAWRISASSPRNAAIDCSIPSGRCNASIWLVILSKWRSSVEKSGPAGIAGAIGGAPRGGVIKFALARSDFCDREVQRPRIERRRGTIDLGRGALDQVGLALRVL